jgi:hypothetical protein
MGNTIDAKAAPNNMRLRTFQRLLAAQETSHTRAAKSPLVNNMTTIPTGNSCL